MTDSPTHKAKRKANRRLAEARGSAPQWTPNGCLVAKDGTSYCVQREQTLGAQNGGLIYYAWCRKSGDSQWSAVDETTRSRESAVRKIIERIVKAQNTKLTDTGVEERKESRG